jgi:hypothetical protein
MCGIISVTLVIILANLLTRFIGIVDLGKSWIANAVISVFFVLTLSSVWIIPASAVISSVTRTLISVNTARILLIVHVVRGTRARVWSIVIGTDTASSTDICIGSVIVFALVFVWAEESISEISGGALALVKLVSIFVLDNGSVAKDHVDALRELAALDILRLALVQVRTAIRGRVPHRTDVTVAFKSADRVSADRLQFIWAVIGIIGIGALVNIDTLLVIFLPSGGARAIVWSFSVLTCRFWIRTGVILLLALVNVDTYIVTFIVLLHGPAVTTIAVRRARCINAKIVSFRTTSTVISVGTLVYVGTISNLRVVTLGSTGSIGSTRFESRATFTSIWSGSIFTAVVFRARINALGEIAFVQIHAHCFARRHVSGAESQVACALIRANAVGASTVGSTDTRIITLIIIFAECAVSFISLVAHARENAVRLSFDILTLSVFVARVVVGGALVNIRTISAFAELESRIAVAFKSAHGITALAAVNIAAIIREIWISALVNVDTFWGVGTGTYLYFVSLLSARRRYASSWGSLTSREQFILTISVARTGFAHSGTDLDHRIFVYRTITWRMFVSVLAAAFVWTYCVCAISVCQRTSVVRHFALVNIGANFAVSGISGFARAFKRSVEIIAKSISMTIVFRVHCITLIHVLTGSIVVHESFWAYAFIWSISVFTLRFVWLKARVYALASAFVFIRTLAVSFQSVVTRFASTFVLHTVLVHILIKAHFGAIRSKARIRRTVRTFIMIIATHGFVVQVISVRTWAFKSGIAIRCGS